MKRFIAILLVVVGAIGIAVGVIYLVEPSRSLPSFFPGHVGASASALAAAVHHKKKGAGAAALGVVLVVVGLILNVGGGRAPRNSPEVSPSEPVA